MSPNPGERRLADGIRGWRRQTSQKQREFMVVTCQAHDWSRERTIVVKAECHVAGTNRRAVVTSRPRSLIVPQCAGASKPSRSNFNRVGGSANASRN